MSDVQHGSPAASTRIKRNSACTSCRDAKVRCNSSSHPERPCQRCAKLNLSCVVDKTHKRISRKSKIDELAQEIQSIKQSVGDRSTPGYIQPHESQLGVPSSGASQPIIPDAVTHGTAMAPSPVLHTPAATSVPDPDIEPSLPRSLGSLPFSGMDIDYYFQKFFECHHPYMPVLKQRDPNRCYESAPFLFWVVIYIASRRYARNSIILPYLVDAVKKEMFSAIASIPHSISTLNAFILLCTWIYPDVRFLNDSTSLLSSVIGNSSLLLGIHLGKGGHPEYSHGIFVTNFTEEEAAYTWGGYNIIAQRVSSYLGIPPIGGLFNQTIQNVIDGRTSFYVATEFRVQLECQKFCNHISKTIAACLEESRGVSTHVVRMLEDEWNAIRGLVCSERANDLDRFNALLVQLEIQVYYLIPPPGFDPEASKRNILRAYNTAQAVVRDALELDRTIGFLSHVPHFYFRTMTQAVCIIFKLLRSSYMSFIDRQAAEASARDAITVCNRCSVMEADLPMRLSHLLVTWFDIARSPGNQWQEVPVSSFSHRLNASVTLDCLARWKNDRLVNKSGATMSLPPACGSANEVVPAAAAGPADPMMMEPLQNIDWSFMDDFDWSFEPGILGTSG
ncbi:hypothetical protein F4778DRAFT_763226 [Xylariomycetidae sp. FL2044]|nr:hypothetical protein F4778DRAFT_763226 [Xylariomycetidae sp. FL2044]